MPALLSLIERGSILRLALKTKHYFFFAFDLVGGRQVHCLGIAGGSVDGDPWSALDVVDAYNDVQRVKADTTGKAKYSFVHYVFAADANSNLVMSGNDTLQVCTHHSAVKHFGRLQPNRRPKENVGGQPCCVLCGRDQTAHTICRPLSVCAGDCDKWVHAMCREYSTVEPQTCTKCHKSAATVQCGVLNCTNTYHLMCAYEAGAEVVSSLRKLFCPQHCRNFREQKKIRAKYPKNVTQRYLCNNAIKIDHEHYETINKYFNGFVCDDSWFTSVDYTGIIVRKISAGHWAFCPQMAHNGKKQFEAIAARKFYDGEVIAEYTGEMIYNDDAKDSNSYLAELWLNDHPELNDLPVICIDAHRMGNEARFINSVSQTTPDFVQKNCELVTGMARGTVRVFVLALRPIEAGEPLVLDYGESYFADLQKQWDKEEKKLVSTTKQVSNPQQSVVEDVESEHSESWDNIKIDLSSSLSSSQDQMRNFVIHLGKNTQNDVDSGTQSENGNTDSWMEDVEIAASVLNEFQAHQVSQSVSTSSTVSSPLPTRSLLSAPVLTYSKRIRKKRVVYSPKVATPLTRPRQLHLNIKRKQRQVAETQQLETANASKRMCRSRRLF